MSGIGEIHRHHRLRDMEIALSRAVYAELSKYLLPGERVAVRAAIQIGSVLVEFDGDMTAKQVDKEQVNGTGG